MHIFVFFIVVLALSYTETTANDRDVDEAWENYKVTFGFRSADEKARKVEFSKTHSMIEKHKQRNSAYEMKHNKFSILTDREKQRRLGAEPPAVDQTARMYTASALERQLQAVLVDHRSDPCMQPVKDQGSCGSCWAFSTTTALEFMTCRKTKNPVSLSEQQLVDCSFENFGCDGGWPGKAWEYIQENGGIENSLTYPYAGKFTGCNYNADNSVTNVTTVNYIKSQDVESMKSVLANYGPIAVAISVVNSFFNYGTGIYVEPVCNKKVMGWHAMSIVGYGTLNTSDYWVVRNSWSADWGIGGYVLFKRGSNQCGIETYPAFPSI